MVNGYGNGSIIQLDKGKDGKKPKNKCRKWRLVVSLGRDQRGAGDDAAEQARAAAAAALVESGEADEGAKPKKPKRRYRQKAM